MSKRAFVGLVAFALSAPNQACTPGLPPLPPPSPRECARSVGQSRLLLVGPGGMEIASEITAHLQADQLVAVRMEGCEMHIVKGCTPHRNWYYVGYNAVTRETRVRSEAELFANVASVDDKLRRHLGGADELVVRTITSGRWDWMIDAADVRELHLTAPPSDEAFVAAGQQKSLQNELAACGEATHVVTMMTAGSYALYAEGQPTDAKYASKYGSKSGPMVIETVGDPAACEAARPGDTAPPKRCGTGYAIELLPIGGTKKLEPVCAGHTTWNGTQCADACGVGFNPQHCSS